MENYADYSASTGIEPMNIVAFFGSSDEHWLKTWREQQTAPTKELEAAAVRNKNAQH